MTEPGRPMGSDLIGETVHYVSHGTPLLADGSQVYPARCRAATITELDAASPNPYVVGLAVLNPTGLFFRCLAEGGSRYDEDDHAAGTWHWPGMACP